MTIFRILLGALGIGLAYYGVELLLKMSTTDLGSVAVWFIGAILAENLIFGPAAALVGVLGHYVLPARWWPAYAVGAFTSLALILIAVPVLGREGAVPGNHSILDRDYTVGLLISLAVVWAGVAAYLLLNPARRSPAAAAESRNAHPRADAGH
ncbi:hypothetical protein [Nocardia seriolae]|uniref:Uncharacterized protein n=1 Tax=Nocardia seriolae TaxID=37332 RepID=A0A0B8NER7_9NOCA|nr:hypothetical protein [Nocardia seriolae]APA99739.1 hypothetical protein NS506_05696 [Nocardia seriolae]MTJ62664.1 hypothetical protein [Nocardia seriolae]MTJ73686.1 hypothetical protein [Nocardia seriolae]MTJ89294.1 hypothetical protein [Nocardia seriolae]MTK33272.1 hypothetical protein [Nocardia seriolae]